MCAGPAKRIIPDTVYVKNLAPTVTDEDIIAAFSEFGDVKLPTIRNKCVVMWGGSPTVRPRLTFPVVPAPVPVRY